jgi:lipid-A-disaccharide synthase-like uncharacterized protein
VYALLEAARPTGWAIQALVWTGNACYFSRFLIQWIASERSGRNEAPRIFWWLSVVGSVLVGLYTWVIGEPVLLLSYSLVLAIYVRNLSLREGRAPRPRTPLGPTIAVAVVAWATVVWFGMHDLKVPQGETRAWVVVSVVGTAVWSSRFIVQWIKSERRGVAYFPRTFWWLSLVGNVLLLAYVIHLRDTGLIAGLAIGPIVQVRNLMIAYRAPRIAQELAPHNVVEAVALAEGITVPSDAHVAAASMGSAGDTTSAPAEPTADGA